MEAQTSVQVDITLRFERHTVTGELRTRDGESRTFVGWLGLLAALERERPHPPAAARPETR